MLSATTLPAIAREYRNHLVGLRRAEATITTRLVYVRALLDFYPEPLECTPADLQRFLAARGDWAPSTHNVAVSSIRSFYAWAAMTRQIDENPARYLELLKLKPRRRPIASDRDATSALEHAEPAERLVLLLGMEAGLRRGEIAKVHTRDRDGEWLYVLGKGGVTRRIHCTPTLLDELDANEPAGGGYYFPGKYGGHIHHSTVWLITKRLMDINPHAMRHRAGTTVFRGTKDIMVTQQFLGHRNVNTTMGYVHIEDDALMLASAAAQLPTAA
jgi:integrase